MTTCDQPSSDGRTSRAVEMLLGEDFEPEVAAVRSAGFRLLLDRTGPVGRQEWARCAGVSMSTLSRVIEDVIALGRVQLDEEGRLLGIAGLSIAPTRHRLEIGGVTKWTWCALDAVGILGVLEADGVVYSTDPASDEDILVRFVEGAPDGDAHIFILGGGLAGNVRESWCPMVNFFASRRAAEAWAEKSGVDGDIVTVGEIAGQAAAMWRNVVDAADPSTHC